MTKMTMIPVLPAGDTWEVENVNYDGKKTMLIAWRHNHPGGGYHHVASETFVPGDPQAFNHVYQAGLERIERDRKADALDLNREQNFQRAKGLADEHNKMVRPAAKEGEKSL